MVGYKVGVEAPKKTVKERGRSGTKEAIPHVPLMENRKRL